MRVLVACEYSGAVRNAFRALGHEAYSCDLLPSDDNSEFHIQGDCLIEIAKGWDLVIAHPPCTHLAVSGARHFAAKRADGRQQQGIDFFMAVVKACEQHAKAWAVENPICIMSTIYRKPNQIIQPWQFGHGETKSTCLWTNNLPKLVPTDIVDGRVPRVHQGCGYGWNDPRCWKERSKTYPGIAKAMAEQWSV
jgi:hypothetical protein